ncbi:hypothetical protein [Maribacter cobaltidurans]|uniref:Uncharacterized protein n=1 Tax=Maribacter cobaltidurans TaxID=1178778 RepID=A0A223V8J0_9FLAO|nr:hypothetical protein [Maribacter cobaltidurans]ASV31612.1 hypothetical protein CJ263_16095 [Maribacter cobaltidurans]
MNLFANNLKDKKNVAELPLGAVGSGFWCFRSWGRRSRVPTALAIWFSGALGGDAQGAGIAQQCSDLVEAGGFQNPSQRFVYD